MKKKAKKSKQCKCGCGRKRAVKHRLNETCKNRLWREKNPIGHAFKNLRTSAKKRGKVFTITIGYFKKLCEQTGYIEGKGLTGESLTIDRIKNWLGYEEGNVRVITRSNNSTKGALDVAELEEAGIYIREVENSF